MSIRVLLVVEPGIDGVFRHVEGLAHYCLQRGDVEIHLAYSDRRGSVGLRQLVRSIEAAGGATLNLRVGNAPSLADAPAFLRLLTMVWRVRPQIIHAHSSKAGVLVRALRLAGIRAPLFYTPHAYYGLAPRPSRTATTFFNGVERAFGRIGTTINISPDEAGFARQRLGIPAQRTRIIHNPVNTEVFAPATVARRAEARRRLGLPESATILGTIGRLSFQKNPKMLYRAFAAIAPAHPQLVLYHVGQGELATPLAALAVELKIAERVVRRDYLDEPSAFYHAIDALALTSRYEAGWPIVTLEALAANLPLISTDAPGMSDLSQGGLSHCWTAPSGDGPAFADALARWLQDRTKPRPCNHRALAQERFSLEKCFGAVVAEYRAQACA